MKIPTPPGSKKKKILITGGSGYLGSNIINGLAGKYDFIMLKRRQSVLTRILHPENIYRFINIEEFNEASIQDLEIDLLLHCATHYGRRDTDAVNTIESNLLLPLRLLAIVKKSNKDVKFINTDTILDKRINVYSLSKSQFKEWMNFFSNEIRFINVKLEHFYGPLDDPSKFVSFLINNFLKNIPELNLTKGEQYRYFTYIDDIVSAFEAVVDSIDTLPSGLIEFQVSADEAVQLCSFVETVKKICSNHQTQLNFGAIPYREGESMNFNVDTANIKSLGWRPKVSLEDGLKRTVETDRKYL